MIYGLLIGLILVGFFIVKSNRGLTLNGAIARTIGYVLFIPALGALIGLLIQGH